MTSSSTSNLPFAGPPDPGQAKTLDDLISQLRLLKVWAGSPSYEEIAGRVNAIWRAAGQLEREWTTAKNTVAACFMIGRRRPSDELVLAIVEALNADPAYALQWRQALRIVRGETEAATFVQAQDRLPDENVEFTGREAELVRLATLLKPRTSGATVAISVIEGMAGVGKTQLAVHAGRLLMAEYGIGRALFVNLRGFHNNPHRPPADPAAVLDSFLRLLGVPAQHIPHDLEHRTRHYRKKLGDKPTLIVLDNAESADQVRPLLPESPNCPTLITSRRMLSEIPDTEHICLEVFSPDEALSFLRRSIGPDRVDSDRDTAEAIASSCGYLPLALQITASRINAYPDWTLADHLARLTQRREALQLDDDLEVSLGLSYDDLLPDHRHLLRLLSLHPGPDIDVHAAASLAATDLTTTQQNLNRLVVGHLLQQRTPERYELHDLIRTYGITRSYDEDRSISRQNALSRLTDFYLHTAAVAMDLTNPHEKLRRPRIALPDPRPTVTLLDQAAARHWLEIERTNALAAAIHPATRDRAGVTVAFSATLYRYLLTGGNVLDALKLHECAAASARKHGDRAGLATALHNIGATYVQFVDYDSAASYLQQSLAISRELGDSAGEVGTLVSLGVVYQHTGKYELAADCLKRNLTLSREVGDRASEARTLGNMGVLVERLGQFAAAASYYGQAMSIAKDLNDPGSKALALNSLGIVHQRMGNFTQAIDYLTSAVTAFRNIDNRRGEALAIANLGLAHERIDRLAEAADLLQHAYAFSLELGDQYCQGHALTNLGVVRQRVGEHARAIVHQLTALDLFRGIGEPEGEAEALNGLGEAIRCANDPIRALSAHTEALQLSSSIGEKHQQARAHAGLARTYQDTEDLSEARRHFEQALTIYTQLGAPEAGDVRTELAALHES